MGEYRTDYSVIILKKYKEDGPPENTLENYSN